LEDLSVVRRILLKQIFKKIRAGFNWPRIQLRVFVTKAMTVWLS